MYMIMNTSDDQLKRNMKRKAIQTRVLYDDVYTEYIAVNTECPQR